MTMRVARAAILAFAVWCGSVAASLAQNAACPVPGQIPMLIVQLFFGQSVNGRPLPDKAWRSFLAETVTPRFPDGLTVYDAYGQWRDPRTKSIGRERTKVVVIATEDTDSIRRQIAEVAAAYRVRFHQQSVGVLTNPGCGAF
jgi:hypothetical protein